MHLLSGTTALIVAVVCGAAVDKVRPLSGSETIVELWRVMVGSNPGCGRSRAIAALDDRDHEVTSMGRRWTARSRS